MIKLSKDGNKKKIISNRIKLEKAIISQNKLHHQKVFQTKAYKDKIYIKLINEEIRDRILNGQLNSNEYDSNDMYEFLMLLQ